MVAWTMRAFSEAILLLDDEQRTALRLRLEALAKEDSNNAEGKEDYLLALAQMIDNA